MTTKLLAYKLCSTNLNFKITHVSSATVSIYMTYIENKLRINIRISDHLKDKGNNYYDLQIIMSENAYLLHYSKLDKMAKRLAIGK